MSESIVQRADIEAAYPMLAPYTRLTPTAEIEIELGGSGAQRIVLKLECLQHSGSFRVRGAFCTLLPRRPGPAGVAAASGGNHGAAVAYAARRLGIKGRIFVPEISSPAKIERIRA